MITLNLSGRNYDIDPKLADYVAEKIGGLDKYVPRRVRASANADIVLQDDPSGRQDNRFVCHVEMTISGTKFHSKEGTLNMYAAVDIVEAKLKAQLRTYKDKHALEPRRTKMLSRIVGRTGESELAVETAEVNE